MHERSSRRGSALAVLAAVFTLGMTGEAGVPLFFAQPPVATTAQRFFVSGHSLTDRPFPDMLEDFARQGGRTLSWERQHIGGSSIRHRSAGAEGTPPGSGFAAGTDRAGNPI